MGKVSKNKETTDFSPAAYFTAALGFSSSIRLVVQLFIFVYSHHYHMLLLSGVLVTCTFCVRTAHSAALLPLVSPEEFSNTSSLKRRRVKLTFYYLAF